MKTFIQAKVIAVASNQGNDKAEFPYLALVETTKKFDGMDVQDTTKVKSAVKLEKGEGIFEVKITAYEQKIFHKILAQLKELPKVKGS